MDDFRKEHGQGESNQVNQWLEVRRHSPWAGFEGSCLIGFSPSSFFGGGGGGTGFGGGGGGPGFSGFTSTGGGGSGGTTIGGGAGGLSNGILCG